jgi:hypothetical protein
MLFWLGILICFALTLSLAAIAGEKRSGLFIVLAFIVAAMGGGLVSWESIQLGQKAGCPRYDDYFSGLSENVDYYTESNLRVGKKFYAFVHINTDIAVPGPIRCVWGEKEFLSEFLIVDGKILLPPWAHTVQN